MNRRRFLMAGMAAAMVTGRTPALAQGCARMQGKIVASAQRQGFGGAVLVEKNGKLVFERGFRRANIPFDIPNGRDTRYRIASVTKLFTSVLVMQLVEQRRLSLTDTIGVHLPGYAGEGQYKVTLYQLLTATSGLQDFGRNHGEAYSKPWSEEELLERLCGGPLAFPPGSKWNYNNADYYLLGKILEAVWEKPYGGILQEQILRPLNLVDTGMADAATIIPRLATPYIRDRQTDALSNEPFFYIQNYGAAGAMYSSPYDLLAFSRALYGGRLLGPAALKQLLTPNLASYGLGIWLFNRNLDGKTIRMAERQGAIAGTGARLVRLLDHDATIVLLANIWPRNMDGLERDIVQELVS